MLNPEINEEVKIFEGQAMSKEVSKLGNVAISTITAEVDVMHYKDYLLYLEHLFEKIRIADPSYSQRKFSKDLGFSGSGYISLVIQKKKNLAFQGIRKISSSLHFSTIEQDYFEQLVYLSQERNKAKKSEISRKLAVIKHEHKKLIIDEPLNYYLSNRMCSVIGMLVNIYGAKFQPDPLWIIRRVRIQTTIEEINNALHFLLSKKIIQKVDGVYQNCNKLIATTEDIKSEVIQNAHKQFFKESEDALSLGVKEREYGHVTVLVDEAKFESLREKIKEIKDEIRSLANSYEKSQDKSKIAVALNLQLYPITRSI